jgi:hypothetical protein
VTIAFIEENGAPGTVSRVLQENVTSGESFVIPQGLTHFQFNPTCKEAKLVATFTNRDPGVQTTAKALFTLPSFVRRAAFGISDDMYDVVSTALSKTVYIGSQAVDPECAKECGLAIPESTAG